MKTMIVALSLLLSASVMAESVQEAKNLWAERGKAVKKALQAADMYKKLANAAGSDVEKGVLLTKSSQARYFYANRQGNKDVKKAEHNKGYKDAVAAYKLLGKNEKTPVAGATKAQLAEAYYFAGINLGKWGQANGIRASLGNLKEMYKTVLKAQDLDESVEEYGPDRTLGRLKHKVPKAFLGLAKMRDYKNEWGHDKALAHYKNAYKKTLTPVRSVRARLSKNPTTMLYYLDLLAKEGKGREFCKPAKMVKSIYDGGEKVMKEYNAARVPEATGDFGLFVACLKDKKKCSHDELDAGKKNHNLFKGCK